MNNLSRAVKYKKRENEVQMITTKEENCALFDVWISVMRGKAGRELSEINTYRSKLTDTL